MTAKDRPLIQEVYSNFATEISKRSTCNELHVGAIVTSADFERIYSVGYNGGIKGGDNKCDNVGIKCGCIHAEVNAMIKCSVIDKQKIMFVTTSPCEMCAKLIINAGFKAVYFSSLWKSTEGIFLIMKGGIEVLFRRDYNIFESLNNYSVLIQ